MDHQEMGERKAENTTQEKREDETMIPISMEFGRSVWYLLTEESSSESLLSTFGILLLLAILFILFMAIPTLHRRYFPKGIKHTRENLVIGRDVIPWSDIEKVSLKKSEWGNPYLVFHFRDKRSPKSYNMQSFANMEEFINRLKDIGVKTKEDRKKHTRTGCFTGSGID